MGNKVYVGNLAYGVDSGELQRIFGEFGQIDDCTVITDRATGRSKGFGFVTFASDEDAQAAIEALNGKEIAGRTATVNVARPREDRGGGGGGRGGRGGYGGGGGGGNRRY